MLALILAATSLLSSPDKLQVVNGTVEKVKYDGREAVKLLIAKGKLPIEFNDGLERQPCAAFEDSAFDIGTRGEFGARSGTGPPARQHDAEATLFERSRFVAEEFMSSDGIERTTFGRALFQAAVDWGVDRSRLSEGRQDVFASSRRVS